MVTKFLRQAVSTQKNAKLYHLDSEYNLSQQDAIQMYAWDGAPNFGDMIGPWIAAKLTGKVVLNVASLKSSSGAILGVGSIIGTPTVHHRNMKIWGSGLITDKKIHKTMLKLKLSNVSQIVAVRGLLTQKKLSQYGFDVQPIYGDPGLVFSQLYDPVMVRENKKIVIVPHYIHFEFFQQMNLGEFHVVDVRKNVTKVVDEISSADVVISTSLHGLIIAQSYGIPWVHLHIQKGLLLSGDDFKFRDFFTVLENDDISQVQVSITDIDRNKILSISKKATLPAYKKIFNKTAITDTFLSLL